MSATKQDPRAPITFTWNAIPGLRCPLCGWDVLADSLVDVNAAYADHMTNVHPDTTSLLLRRQDEPTADEPDPDSPAVAVVASADWPVWYRERREKAEKDGIVLPDLLVGETQKAFDERLEGA